MRGLVDFVWDFVVGDDWRTALGLVAALGLTALSGAWWVLPLAVCGLLVASLWRARLAAQRECRGTEARDA